ncbi:unnamed protein product [Urochloa humidicola]
MSSLLSAAGAALPARSASAVVAKPARGFHVFRVDGYSVTTTLPAGERITSAPFDIGGRCWLVDYFPNGTDASAADSNAIAVYLRLENTHQEKERVRAEYKFALLDAAGTAAYELPAETGIFTSDCDDGYGVHVDGNDDSTAGKSRCGGYAAFITKEDLGRRREILLKEDSLAIRCDVAVAVVVPLPLAIAPPVHMRDVRMVRGRGMGEGGVLGAAAVATTTTAVVDTTTSRRTSMTARTIAAASVPSSSRRMTGSSSAGASLLINDATTS